MRGKRVDDNQQEIISALRKAGVLVLPLHEVGKGCPDILCGFRSTLVLLEIKDGNKPPSRRKLTPEQERFHTDWKGFVRVVSSVDEALEAVT